jgi:cytochrome c peroxidase
MREAFGPGVFNNAELAFLALTVALEAYQRESQEFVPFSSKYDDTLAGRAKLGAAEARGLVLFNDPDKGNCAACHTSARQASGVPPLFTNFAYANIRVPGSGRDPNDPAQFDLGLCGPERTDLAARRDLCGAFKVPTLRNVATRKVFFHDGGFTRLEDAIAVHVRRDASLKPGQVGTPRLTPSEIGDVAAFLGALTDDPRPR